MMSSCLLQYMGQFMGCQCILSRSLSGSKINVLSIGKRLSIQHLAQLNCFVVGMRPYRAKILSKARFHEGASFRVEGLSGGVEEFVDDGGILDWGLIVNFFPLH